MAEYIDRAEVLELKQDYGEGQYLMMLIDPVLVKKLSTADVIERSKIDKAIEEIEQLINHSKLPTVNIYNKYSDGLKDCLEILKRNIGE